MLLITTAVLAVLSTTAVWLLTGRWATPALFYWVGWLLGIPAYLLGVHVDLVPRLNEYGEGVILLTHYGATIGFIVASLLGIGFRSKAAQPAPQFNGLVWVIVGIQAVLGLGLLASRIGSVGLDLFAIRTDYLADAYLTDSLPASVRLYNYVALTALVPSILIAARGRVAGHISWQSVTLLFLAAAPGGLSTGGRVWVVQTFAAYFLSYLLAPGAGLQVAQSVKRGGQFLVAAALLVGLFTAFGNARDASRGQVNLRVPDGTPDALATQLVAYAPLYGYLGVPTSAAGAYSEFNRAAYGGGHLYGQATFPFFAGQLVRFGLLPGGDNQTYTTEVRKWVGIAVDRRIGTTHATLAPLLVADFGEDNLILSAALTFLTLQFLFLLFMRLGGMWYVGATCIVLYGGLLIFQDASFGTAAAVLPIIAALLLARPLRAQLVWGPRQLTAAR